VRQLAEEFTPYAWAPSTEELARRAGLDPVEIIRFDGNVPPVPLVSSRPGAIAGTLAEINTYPHGGYTALEAAIARYAGVEPENIVLGAGADDLILLVARAFAGPGDTVAIPAAPTYPLFKLGALLAGALVTICHKEDSAPQTDPVLTFACRPGNPFGELGAIPDARPLAVDEAYFEYAGESAVGLIEKEDVVVIRTMSKAFGLAGARVGYALARADIAAELRRRQSPAPVSTLSAALAVAALRNPPDLSEVVEERERLAAELRSLGFETTDSRANFVFCKVDDPQSIFDKLLAGGCVVRITGGGIRITVRDRDDDDLLLQTLASDNLSQSHSRRVRSVRATAETAIRVRLDLDGAGRVRVQTGAGIYDHFLEQLAFHGGFDLNIEGAGDLETGPHHTAEDTAIAFGDALDRALGDRVGISRYGAEVVVMDDARADVAVDLGGRRGAEIDLEHDPGLARHVLETLASAARLTLHVKATGRDEHHIAEAAYKALGRALKKAVQKDGEGLPSTKGVL
jgi:histidinol-phosphate/aromatic aminotransferase/cobyric acid decarboxylase-like protein/imidazoleglycerol phosphate dehydratase HisB